MLKVSGAVFEIWTDSLVQKTSHAERRQHVTPRGMKKPLPDRHRLANTETDVNGGFIGQVNDLRVQSYRTSVSVFGWLCFKDPPTSCGNDSDVVAVLGCPGTEVRIKGWDQWVLTPMTTPFISTL